MPGGKDLQIPEISLVAATALVILLVVGSMARRPALRRLGLRNFSRRKGNTALVIVGSMVGTALISGSLVLNDSTDRFQESEARERLGEIDEVVQQSGQRLPGDRRPAPLFGEEVISRLTAENIRQAADDPQDARVDGVLPALVEELPVEVVGSEEATPDATVVGVDWERLREFGSSPPEVASLPAPQQGEAYVSEGLAESLGVGAGDVLRLSGQSAEREVEVAEVIPERGISGYREQFSGSEGTILVSQADARALLEAGQNEANTVFISNQGGVVSGLEGSAAVAGAVRDLLSQAESGSAGTDFQVQEAKKDTIQQGGFQIGDIFLMISSFAILAGILLIVNIYVMLAEERKAELGILRAVALKRSGLVRVFTYEGFVYSVLASLIGAAAGLGIASLLVRGINRAGANFDDLLGQDLTIPFYFEPTTPVVAFCAGLLITFLTVFATSLRVSALNIVAAIRDLPEEKPQKTPRGRLALEIALLIVGLTVSIVGFAVQSGYAMMIGPVVAAAGLGLLVSPPLPPRLVWSVVGGAILAYAYFANELEPVARVNETEPAMFFISGVFMVLGAVAVVTFNLPIIYGGLGLLSRIVPPLAPILRVAVAHPSAHRARTGFTLAMFALVIYVVTLSAVFSETQSRASAEQRDSQLSGYDGAVQSGPLGEIENFKAQIQNNPTLDEAITSYARISAIGVTLPEYPADEFQTEFGPPTGQAAPGAGISEYLTFVSDDYLNNTTDELASRAPRFETDREAWRALAENPDLVMLTFPYDGSGDFLARPRLGAGDTITLQDPVTGEKVEKTVAGRVENTSGFSLGVINGVIASQSVADEFQSPTAQQTYLLRLSEDANLDAVGEALEDQFADEGAQSFLVEELIGRAQAFIDTFIRIVQAFLAFGLIVGVAGLAVISARAVHERRRDIGTLRAVGFKRRTIGWQFVVENSLVSLLGLVIGIAVGALGGYNLFEFTVDDPGVQYVFPWAQMLIIGAGVWAAALVSTIAPAFRASRVPPVEALRHQG